MEDQPLKFPMGTNPKNAVNHRGRRDLGAAKPATKSFAAQQDRRVPEVSGQRSEVGTETRKSVQKNNISTDSNAEVNH
jgi:hypothetical protein